jgi:hypothetical protein
VDSIAPFIVYSIVCMKDACACACACLCLCLCLSVPACRGWRLIWSALHCCMLAAVLHYCITAGAGLINANYSKKLIGTMVFTAVQCSAVQCSAAQCSAVQCSAVQLGVHWNSCSAIRGAAATLTLSLVIPLHCTALHCTDHCTALHCTALH